MDINRNLVITLNFIVLVFMMYVFYEEGLPDQEKYILYIIPITIILTIHYLITNKSNNMKESLFSLWLKLKRKNIKDELEK